MKKQTDTISPEEQQAYARMQDSIDQWLLKNGHVKALRSPATERAETAPSEPSTTAASRAKP